MGKTAQQMKADFIEQAAPLVEQYIKTVMGDPSALKSVDKDIRIEVWGLLKQFMKGSDEKIIIPEEYKGTPEGVIKAVEDGHITLEEGERLIDLYRGLKAIDTMESGGTLNQTLIPSLTINTAPPKLIEE